MAAYIARSYSSFTRGASKVRPRSRLYPTVVTRTSLSRLKSHSFKFRTSQICLVKALVSKFRSERLGSGNAIDHKEFVSSFLLGNFKFTIRNSSDYSLADAFGANAWQDKNWIVLDKGDLGFIGELSVEQFLIALVLRWANSFEPDRRIRCQYWRSIPVFFQSRWWDKHSFLIYLLAINSPNFPSPNSFLV